MQPSILHSEVQGLKVSPGHSMPAYSVWSFLIWILLSQLATVTESGRAVKMSQLYNWKWSFFVITVVVIVAIVQIKLASDINSLLALSSAKVNYTSPLVSNASIAVGNKYFYNYKSFNAYVRKSVLTGRLGGPWTLGGPGVPPSQPRPSYGHAVILVISIVVFVAIVLNSIWR